MIRAGLFILAGTIWGTCGVAQAQTTPPAQSQPAPNASAQPTTSAASPQPTTDSAKLPSGPAVNAELNSSVDSRKAKVGDKVEAHTTQALKNGDQVIPKGTKLIGHVTEASARAKGDEQSSLAIQFDKALPKKDQEIPLNVLIMAVAPPAQNNGQSNLAAPLSETTSLPGNDSRMGRQPNPSGTPGEYSATGADGTNAPPTGSNSGGLLPANSRGVYGISELKLMLKTSNASPETVLTSSGKDVHLDGGTRLLLVEVAGSPST